MSVDPQIEDSWKRALEREFGQEYFAQLKQFLVDERASGRMFYPPGSQIFRAFDQTPFDSVRVVVVGQDPYHGPGQANGLCFSVKPGIPLPPSLLNIYRELESDLGIAPADHGDLEHWAQQGVLLLNATLTVGARRAGSHQGKGWEQFTDAVVRTVNDRCEGVVFVLWGRYAQEKGAIVDSGKHFVISSPHPSPFSANKGFFGSRPFSRINEHLRSRGTPEIDWKLPSAASLTPDIPAEAGVR
jgi:uracil-DNA glycosylase